MLFGENGNDTLVGNAGADFLKGGLGNDRYLFNRGDGRDTLVDLYLDDNLSMGSGGSDTLAFGSGIVPGDIIAAKEGKDLIIALKEDGISFDQLVDRIQIKNWYMHDNRIENFEFQDGTTWSAVELISHMGTPADDIITGLNMDTVFTDNAGDDAYEGMQAGDTYYFGPGHGRDTLSDLGGMDRIVFKQGIQPQDLRITWRQGSYDIIITYQGNETDQLTLEGWYSTERRVETFEFADGTAWTPVQILAAMETEGEDVYNGLEDQNNIIHARGGDDIISAFEGDDALYGGHGADGLDGQAGNDTLAGEAGDDLLWGGRGDDVYVFNRGDGKDTILDDDKLALGSTGNDLLRLSGGIAREDLVFKIDPVGDRLYIGIKNPAQPDLAFEELTDVITIENWFLAKNRIEGIELTATGQILSVADILAAMGTDGDDAIRALSEGSVLNGGPGHDSLYGNAGDDDLAGGSGDDVIKAGAGKDTLHGGLGADTLNGQDGDDTYVYNRGDGRDMFTNEVKIMGLACFDWIVNPETGQRRWGRLSQEYTVNGGTDTLTFGSGILPEDLLVRPSGEDILLGLKEPGKAFEELADIITIKDGFSGLTAIEAFRFEDGRVLTTQEILDLMYTEGDDVVTYETNADLIANAKGGNDSVTTGAGNDRIRGGAGSDSLNGGLGNDVYMFGRGDGRDHVADKGLEAWWQYSAGDDAVRLTGGLSQNDLVVAWGGLLTGYYRNGEFLGDTWDFDVVYENHDNDLIIGLREDGKSPVELADRMLVQDWFNQESRIESIVFDDGSTLDSQAVLDAVFTQGPDRLKVPQADMGHVFNSLDGDDDIAGGLKEDVIHAGGGNDTAAGGRGRDLISGQAGDDIIFGDEPTDYAGDRPVHGDDVLDGGLGDDILQGNGGFDSLTGGQGGDSVYGGLGDDVYFYERGHGRDLVQDQAGFSGERETVDRFGHSSWITVQHEFQAGNDTLVFGPGIRPEDVLFVWDYQKDADGAAVNRDRNIGKDDLIVALKDPANPDAGLAELADQIVLKDWFKRAVPRAYDEWDDPNAGVNNYPAYADLHGEYVNRIDSFRFENNGEVVVLSGRDMVQALQSERDDRIEAASDEAAMICGLSGNDVLSGHKGDDELYGGAGNDRLNGGYGQNILDGGQGDDTYVVTSENNPPWDNYTSHDRITDGDGIDKVLFLNDIAREDIIFTKEGEDLLITYGVDRQHSLRIAGNSVENFEMNDRSFIRRQEIEAALAAIAVRAGRPLESISAADIAGDLELKTILYNAWTDRFTELQGYADWNRFTGNTQNEVVFGGGDQDELIGHSGNDIFHGLTGDDTLNAGNGNDVYVFSRGDNNDTILDAEDPRTITGGDNGGGGGGGEGEGGGEGGGDDGGDDGGNAWEITANPAPSDDTLRFRNDIHGEDLEVYWTNEQDDSHDSRLDDLLIRVNPGGGPSGLNDRAANISTILDYYSSRILYEYTYNTDLAEWEWQERALTAADLEGYGDKVIRHFAYELQYGRDRVTYTMDFSALTDFLNDYEKQAAYLDEYRPEADSIRIRHFYDRDYTIENFTLEAENRNLTLAQIMDIMSTDKPETIRGVDWAGNVINAEAGGDAVMGGDLNDTIQGGHGSDFINGRNGDDTYLFEIGDGRDSLRDDIYEFRNAANDARYWESRENFADEGTDISTWEPSAGFDTVIFGAGLSVRNVGFARFPNDYASGLYVGYGAKIAADDENGDWVTDRLGSAAFYAFGLGLEPAGTMEDLVYADDIYIPNQLSVNRDIDKFVMADGAWISADEVMAGIQAARNYAQENAAILADLSAFGREARGYVEQVLLGQWHRMDKTINGTDNADQLNAGDGDDTVNAGAGDDVITGGFGADQLNGGSGNDTYLYNRWDGRDTILDNAGSDKLVLGPELAARELRVFLDETTGDLTVGMIDEVQKGRIEAQGGEYAPGPGDLNQKIVVGGWYGLEGRMEEFVINDETLGAMEFYNRFFTSEGDDVIKGLAGDNVIDAKAGNDEIRLGNGNQTVHAGAGDDMVVTGSGNDIIHGDAGSDVIAAGAGNDTIYTQGAGNSITGGAGSDALYGGSGGDTYHYQAGEGTDVIYDAGGIDELALGDGILATNTGFAKSGDDVVITLQDGSTIRIRDFALPDSRIENLRFGDGTLHDLESLLPDPNLPGISAENYNLTIQEDQAVQGGIVLTNAGSGVSFIVAENCANGHFSVNPDGTWSYTPNPHYYGNDRVTVAISNSLGQSTTSILQFEILSVNFAPEVTAGGPFILQDARGRAGALAVTDPDNDPLTYAVTAAPENGQLVVDATGNWQYTAAEGFMGLERAVIAVDDGNGGRVEAVLDFDVRVSPPTMADQNFSLPEDGTVTGFLEALNPIGGPVTYSISQDSANGGFTLGADGAFAYLPNADFNGADQTIVTVTNAYGLSASAGLNFTITPVNDAPVLNVPQENLVVFGVASVAGRIEASDVEGDSLNCSVAVNPGHGTIRIDQSGNWYYFPLDGYLGADQAVINVEDGQGGSAAKTLNFTMTGYVGGDVVIPAGGAKTLCLPDIGKDDLQLSREGRNLLINVRARGTITLADYFLSPAAGVSRLETGDGPLYLGKDVILENPAVPVNPGDPASYAVFYGRKDVRNLIFGGGDKDKINGANRADVLFGWDNDDILYGKEGDDTLICGSGADKAYGNTGDDTLYGDGGSDVLYGMEGRDMLVGGGDSDKLYGYDGDDRLYGDDGNDTLDSGIGNDLLVGGKDADYCKGGGGDDIYCFKPGDGSDTIWDRYTTDSTATGHKDGGLDTIRFGQGTAKEDVAIFLKYETLRIQYGDTDVIQVQKQSDSLDAVERIELSDGSYLTSADINRIAQEMAAYAVNEGISLTSVEDVRRNQDLMTLITSAWHPA